VLLTALVTLLHKASVTFSVSVVSINNPSSIVMVVVSEKWLFGGWLVGLPASCYLPNFMVEYDERRTTSEFLFFDPLPPTTTTTNRLRRDFGWCTNE
jgi:hypothetical protein